MKNHFINHFQFRGLLASIMANPNIDIALAMANPAGMFGIDPPLAIV